MLLCLLSLCCCGKGILFCRCCGEGMLLVWLLLLTGAGGLFFGQFLLWMCVVLLLLQFAVAAAGGKIAHIARVMDIEKLKASTPTCD